MRKVLKEVKVSEGTPAPAATLSPTMARWTESGSPIATAYQYHLTRQRIIRKPSSLSPATPWHIGITMRAATSGANAPKDPNGTNPHAIT
jgi:hypothetical protein